MLRAPQEFGVAACVGLEVLRRLPVGQFVRIESCWRWFVQGFEQRWRVFGVATVITYRHCEDSDNSIFRRKVRSITFENRLESLKAAFRFGLLPTRFSNLRTPQRLE